MKHTLGSDSTLFAKELNLNPKDYKAGKIIDIAIKTIKSSDNPLVTERVEACKRDVEKFKTMMAPHIEQAVEDKPIFDIIQKIWDLKGGPGNIDIQEYAQHLEKELNHSRVKEKI